MGNEVSIVFQPAGDDLFRPVRIEEEVEGHLRRAREDLSHISVEAVTRDDERLYRIRVAGDDEVTGHAAPGFSVYVMRRPEERGDRRDPRGDDARADEVHGHISRPDRARP